MTTMPYGLRGVAIAAAAGQTAFGFPYPLLDAADLAVVRIRAGGRTTLVLTTDYTLTGAGPSSTSATVTLAVAALAGDTYELVGQRRPERVTDFSPGALSSTALNDDFNRLVLMVQELRRDLDRAVRRPISDPSTGSLLLPPPDATEARILALSTAGELMALDPDTIEEIGDNLFGFPLAVDKGGTGGTTAAAARSNLGLGQLAILNSVGAAQILDGSATETKLGDAAVTAPKVARGVVTLIVESMETTTPPVAPTAGYAWLIPSGAVGDWAGRTGQIAVAGGAGYTYFAPSRGWRVISLAERRVAAYTGLEWVSVGGVTSTLAGRIATHLMQGRFGGGMTRSAVIDSKQVIVWGDGASGKAAHAGTRDALFPETIPFENPPAAITKIVSANGRHFVLDSEGWVHSAGDGAEGALGHGNTTSLFVFKRINAFYSAGIRIADIVVDRSSNWDLPLVCFVTTANQLWTTGNNAYGQRGKGDTAAQTTPSRVILTDNSPLTGVVEVSVGGYPHTVVARLADGTIARWGANATGQLGDGTTTDATKAAIHPTLTDVAEVLACSGNFSAANLGNLYVRKVNGTLLGAGYGGAGELAQGAGDLANKSAFVTISHTETFKRLVGGDGSGLRGAITATDKAVFWGRNPQGAGGNGGTSNLSSIYVPAGAWQGSVTDIRIGGAAATETSYVLAAGEIYAAGYNAQNNAVDGVGVANVTTHAKIVGRDGTLVEWTIAGDATQYGIMLRYSDGRIASAGAGAQGELGWQGAPAASPVLQDVLIRHQRGVQGEKGDGPGTPAVRRRWIRKAVPAGTTTLSGADDYGLVLSYIPGSEAPHINGVRQVRGADADYEATNGTSITLKEALPGPSVIEIETFDGTIVAVDARQVGAGDRAMAALGDEEGVELHLLSRGAAVRDYASLLTKQGDVGSVMVFARTSVATYVNAEGIIETAAAGVPRYEYDRTTRAPLGYLHEPAATNQALYGSDLGGAAWTFPGCNSPVLNTAVAPNGLVEADKIVENSATSTHIRTQSIAITNNALHLFSTWVQAAGRDRFDFNLGSGGFGASVIGAFNLGAGTSVITAAGTDTWIGLEQWLGGWWRVWIGSRGTATQGTNWNLRLRNSSDQASYLGDGTSGLLVWGAQAEIAAYVGQRPSSLIETTAAAVTRAADQLSISAALTPLLARRGTILITARPRGLVAGQRVAALHNGTPTQNGAFIDISAAGAVTGQVHSGGVQQASLALGTIVAGEEIRASIGWQAGLAVGDSSKVTTQTAAGVTAPAAVTTLEIGAGFTGHISEVRVVSRCLPTTVLQSYKEAA